MASLNQVSIELKVTGESQATKALKDFAKSGDRVGTSVLELGRKISSVEGEYRKINELNKQGVVGDNARRTAIARLAEQLAALTGRTKEEAAAALRAAERTRAKAEADRRAAQAAEQLARAQKNLEGSVLRQSQAVNQAVSRMEELERLKASGAVGSRNMAQAELEVARALARTNGYLKANGALNTQKALAELRAAQAARVAAAQADADAATRQREIQSYNQLRSVIDQSYAARMRLKQAADTLRGAVRQGIITQEQAIEQLRRYREAAQQAAAGGGFMGRNISRAGVLTQQAGYQVGDFIVQVQSGTNAFVAFGQQATQIAGTLTLLGGRWILLGTALGITIPLLTAVGAGLMRANVEADAIYEKFGFLEGSVRGLASAFGEAGGVIVNILMTIVQNLDVFVSILGVAAVAAIVKFTAATAAMGTAITAIRLLFTGMAGVELVAASATATLTAAMSRLMVVISAHPIIAAMTAALAAAVFVLYRARDASDGFRSNVEGLSDALKELRDNAKEAGIETARIELGADTSAQAIAMQRILELNEQIAEMQEYVDRSHSYNSRNAQERLDALIAEREEIERLIEADQERIDNLERASAKSSLDAIISSYDKQYAIQVKINDAQDKLNKVMELGLIDSKKMAEILESYEASLNDAADATEDTSASQKRLNDLLEKGRQATLDRGRTNRRTIIDMENQLKLQQEIARYGADSVEVARMRAEQEAIALNLTEKNQKKYVDLALKIHEAKDATANLASNASSLANEMSRAANEAVRFVANLGSGAGLAAAQARVAGLRAELTARQGGAGDVAAAEARARAQAMSDPRTRLALQGPEGLRSETLSNIETEVETARLDAIAGQISGQISELNKTGGGGGTSTTKTQEDYLAKLQSEAELKLRLIGLTEEQQRYQEIVNELKDRELLVGGELSDQQEARIQQIIATESALRKAEQAEKQREDLMNVVTDNIDRSLMGLIEGTTSVEDAFKSMLRNILLEIYNQQVAKPIASGISGFIGNIFGGAGATNAFGGTSAQMMAGGGLYANGGAFNNGNVIPFANGGVVSSPTMFPMAGSQTGLMGEAGPEAIMPLKRGKGGKLGVMTEGGGGNVTVENHFHIAANGDESVKRIIAQEAPRIANLTQKQIIDQRRRGGTMKAAFG